ncbi:VWA domain-containing protein [uncultured Tessaracoccus sp.]|uniref:vWA domain-containing protein n=1 Tax=uncultured Tessaracoccus sp. TaxID=905023 RepID=UPI0026392332|nr:VWA domain-containing protein [uncultured Tessaracoccus sp.]
MALTQPWWGVAVLVAAVLVGLAAWWWPRRREATGDALLFSAGARLRALPQYRDAARRRVRWLTVELLAVAVAVGGAALTVARPVDERQLPSQRSNRDVVLCLDTSATMSSVVQDVLGAYKQLAERLDGERIALVMFDASAVTFFPLTDDAAYVAEQLDAASREVGAGPVRGTQIGDLGTSLIGDGLVSCLQRFDTTDPSRSRTVVFATDNQTSGKSLFTLEEAAGRAANQGTLVFGIVPNDNQVAATQALTQTLKLTGGDTLALEPNAPLESIVDAVERTQARELEGPSRTDAKPLLWPGMALLCLGAAGAAVARRRAGA